MRTDFRYTEIDYYITTKLSLSRDHTSYLLFIIPLKRDHTSYSLSLSRETIPLIHCPSQEKPYLLFIVPLKRDHTSYSLSLSRETIPLIHCEMSGLIKRGYCTVQSCNLELRRYLMDIHLNKSCTDFFRLTCEFKVFPLNQEPTCI
jgi:hypothetical protein